jgi:hypothetical protein
MLVWSRIFGLNQTSVVIFWQMSQKDPPLNINIADPEDIQAKLGEVRVRIATKEDEVRKAQRELRVWQDILRRLEFLAELSPRPAREVAPGPAPVHRGAVARMLQDATPDPGAQEAVVRLLEENGGPLRNSEVADLLPSLNPRTVSWALWNAEREGHIQRVRQGVYAPRGWWDDSAVSPPEGSD